MSLKEPPGFTRSPLVEDPRVRFFVITSNLGENVVKSVEHNVWATQRKNEDALTDAFLHSKAVILIFSVNKSGAFQGYARMRGVPGRSKCRSNPFGGYGRMFDIEWLRLQDVVMPEVAYLRNSLDGGREVGYARDGQELPAKIGAELCRHFDVRVFLEDPKTYEPCVDDPEPVLPPPAQVSKGSDAALRPGPLPAAPPPRHAHELPYPWPAPSYGYPGPPHHGVPPHGPPHGVPPHAVPPHAHHAPPHHAPPHHAPPHHGAPRDFPAVTSPFDSPAAPAAPSGLPPPWAVPPGAWLGHSRRHERRRRRHRRRSSSYSESPGRSSKRHRGADQKDASLPDFTKMTHEEYVEWWKKTHPAAPAAATTATAVAEAPKPPAAAAAAPAAATVSPTPVAAVPVQQEAPPADPVKAAPAPVEALPAMATCFERSEISAERHKAEAKPRKEKKEKKKKKKEAAAAAPPLAKTAPVEAPAPSPPVAVPTPATNGAAAELPKPVKEKKQKKEKKEKKHKKDKDKVIVMNGDAEISGKEIPMEPIAVEAPVPHVANSGVEIPEPVQQLAPRPILRNGQALSAAVAAIPQSASSSVAAAAAAVAAAAPRSILRTSQVPVPDSVQTPKQAARHPAIEADLRVNGKVTEPVSDKSKEDEDEDSESTMAFESDIEEMEPRNGGVAMVIDDGYGSASD